MQQYHDAQRLLDALIKFNQSLIAEQYRFMRLKTLNSIAQDKAPYVRVPYDFYLN